MFHRNPLGACLRAWPLDGYNQQGFCCRPVGHRRRVDNQAASQPPYSSPHAWLPTQLALAAAASAASSSSCVFTHSLRAISASCAAGEGIATRQSARKAPLWAGARSGAVAA